ncbi:cytochrome c oxidase cbb3-type subunit 4 [Hasllibacter halocynthiae]|uniref:Cytochrome c oxidase cbb3-type subunit 4 n=1 Tax=Hasllibacter halocynthiae TaxID=595589 RepID=A0A2T0X683_9RHOB|nr:cytochrome c oxidase cbb3-type subunit 4 [Hasllibacter halocynthiae]
MDTYSLLRAIADSWVLLALFAVFVFVILWAFRPGSRPLHDDAANVPFRHDGAGGAPVRRDEDAAPARRRDRGPPATGCGKGCPGCDCRPLDFLERYGDV